VNIERVITLDFESYYAKGFSFDNFTTEEYVKHPGFEVIGFSAKVDDGPAVWHTGTREEIGAALHSYNWRGTALLCHNMLFDGSILGWLFDIYPTFYLDTLCMGRAIHGVDVGGSLASLAKRYELGEKGTEVVNAKGKHRLDFTPEELARYGAYCINDVELTCKLFKALSADFPEDEINLIDMTLRMFITPGLKADTDILKIRLEELQQEKSELLRSLIDTLGCQNEPDPEGAVRKKLSSNPQFAAILRTYGVEPPMKPKKPTPKNPNPVGKTYALAKNDEGFIALHEHEDPVVQQLCAVRMDTKSTIEESRIQRFIDIAERHDGWLPIPLKYYGAHTGRWAGSDKVNFQNLPSRDIKKKALKTAVIAPEGHVVINCDSSQIEARVLAWVAGEVDVVKAFAEGRDVYSEFATRVFERPISKKDPVERFVGKTCILGLGFGTGSEKLKHTLKTQPPGADMTLQECEDIVGLYRRVNSMIPALWRECDRALGHMVSWPNLEDGKPIKPYYLGKQKVVMVTSSGLRLPNGLHIRYNNLRLENGSYVYDSRKGTVKIWGGAVVENFVQALARIIVGQQMLKMSDRYRPVLTVHDAAVCVVPEDEAEEATTYIIGVMSVPPDWATGLPVACEAKFARSYGHC
jgi:DNA polymerase